jgi:DHA1 family tetracycline resistance protein-like MFS transporter
MTAVLCGLMTLTSLIGGPPQHDCALAPRIVECAGAGRRGGLVALGNAWIGMAAIVLFGIPNAFYNAVVPAWCAERFGSYGQGAVMGLLSTTFCLANILMALVGAALTLLDTRLVLLLGAMLAAWAGWRLRGWRVQHGRRYGNG